ncbi:MAG: amidohydrolase, partial [Desulfovibrionaceae bacterium]|nr:amidohydrolase [Desulfovibrionaceae bacterium]
QGVDCCLAAHIWPQLALGKVGIKSGPLMAATDRFKIFLKGRGGHSSQPHLCDDVLGAVAELALILPREAGGRMNPALPGVLSVCCIQAGHTFNVMPETAQLWGCCRGFHPEVYLAWKKAIEGICAGTAAAYGLEYELVYMPGHGAVNNDPAISNAVGRAAVMTVGAENVVEPQLSMAGEDFACFQEEAPGCLFFLGCGQDGTKGLHSPEFIFDESVLATGCNIFCRAALEILRAD